MLRTALALVAIASVSVRVPEARACQPVELATVLMKPQAEVATDGGLVMVQVRSEDDGWRSPLVVHVDGQRAAHESIWLAPGLELWRVKGAAAGGSAALVDTSGKAGAAATIVAPAGKLRAPAMKAARSSTKLPPRARQARMGSPHARLTIQLARALPADAVALIVQAHQRPEPYPRAWIAVTPGATSFVLEGGGGKGCGGEASPVFAGERISLAWVDARGRVSPASAPRKVTLAR